MSTVTLVKTLKEEETKQEGTNNFVIRARSAHRQPCP